MKNSTNFSMVIVLGLAAASGCGITPEDGELEAAVDEETEAARVDEREAALLDESSGGQLVEPAAIVPLAASSSSIAFTDGTRAAEAFFNRASTAFIDLFDAKCDAHSVYVLYRINNGSEVRKTNSNGCGTTVRFPLQSGAFNISYRACVDIQFASDVCGATVFDHN